MSHKFFTLPENYKGKKQLKQPSAKVLEILEKSQANVKAAQAKLAAKKS